MRLCLRTFGSTKNRAGIMWMGLLKKQDVKMSYLDFIKYGSAVAIPSLAAALGVLCLVL